MSDSKAVAVFVEGLGAAGSKSAVRIGIADLWGSRLQDLLTLERHGARTPAGLRERILARFCCLAAAVTLNHELGRPSRALVNYCA
jgi:hypothetical protein